MCAKLRGRAQLQQEFARRLRVGASGHANDIGVEGRADRAEQMHILVPTVERDARVRVAVPFRPTRAQSMNRTSTPAFGSVAPREAPPSRARETPT